MFIGRLFNSGSKQLSLTLGGEMKIFLTGHKGYIGAHLCKLLKQSGHQVTGCDIGLFEGCEWDPLTPPDKTLNKDIRNLTPKELKGYDCIMHLAAISNDPMGDLDPEITYKINYKGSIDLAAKAKKAGVPRFLFASSCAIYGAGSKLDLDETDPVAPLTPYAESKIAAEKEIFELIDDNFTAASLRNATAYGYSPSLRIDLVVNNLLACAIARGDIRVMSDGTPWRPLIHCKDIARAFIAFMEAPKENIQGRIVNVGGNKENFQVREVINYVKKFVPKANVVFTGEVKADPRNYRVSFDLLSRVVPKFKLEYTLEKGMDELFKKFREKEFSENDFDGDQFVRLRTLKKRMKLIGIL